MDTLPRESRCRMCGIMAGRTDSSRAETEGLRERESERKLLAAQAGICVESGVTEKSMGDWRRKRLSGVKMNGECYSKKCKEKEY